MMKKVLGVVVATALSLCMALGSSVTCQATTASSGGLTVSITRSRIDARFDYPKAGYLLQLKIDYTMVDNTSGQSTTRTKTNATNGNYTSVTCTATSGSEYHFTSVDAYGYVNGAETATLKNIKP